MAKDLKRKKKVGMHKNAISSRTKPHAKTNSFRKIKQHKPTGEMGKPLCFILMPFGLKKDSSGGPDINFDAIYEKAIKPAVESADMVPIRADEERTGGIIHKAMFERLMLCDYAVADLTTANANVFYELGVRHAVRPATTLPIFAKNQKIPFDVNFLRALPYDLGKNNQFGKNESIALMESLKSRLNDLRLLARKGVLADSPVFQLIKDYKAPEIAHIKTDVFRDRAAYSEKIKKELEQARRERNAAAIKRIENNIGKFDGVETGILIDLFLSYRAVGGYKEMLAVYKRFPSPIQHTILVREQYGFALNRLKRRDDALMVLQDVIHEQGPNSETCGLIGRIFKDRWEEDAKKGNSDRSKGFLDKAIEYYTRGFESDWRDFYPGINAVTLLEIKGDKTSLQIKEKILPVVRFAVLQRIKSTEPMYWDYATLLELAVLENDREDAEKWLSLSLATIREQFEPETTERNLKLIAEYRKSRGIAEQWLYQIIAKLKISQCRSVSNK